MKMNNTQESNHAMYMTVDPSIEDLYHYPRQAQSKSYYAKYPKQFNVHTPDYA